METCLLGMETLSSASTIFQVRGICCDLLEYLFYSNVWKTDLAPLHTRSSAAADNGLDAFSGQSRSTNIVPFWVHCDFSLSM